MTNGKRMNNNLVMRILNPASQPWHPHATHGNA